MSGDSALPLNRLCPLSVNVHVEQTHTPYPALPLIVESARVKRTGKPEEVMATLDLPP